MSLSKTMVLDGRALAEAHTQSLVPRVASLMQAIRRPLGLGVVLVGDNPASHLYVTHKVRALNKLNIRCDVHALAADVTQADVLSTIGRLNEDAGIDGILVQLPLPQALASATIIEAVSPDKDVDGLHPLNVGRLNLGQPGLRPCTPLGCMHLLRAAGAELVGANALVIGRSAIVGRPMATMLLEAHATVTVCHAASRDLRPWVKAAEIVVVAAGVPHLIKADWLRPDAIVIDVGINRIQGPGLEVQGQTGKRIVGDVEFEAALGRVRAISPVPKGVGPMTIAMLCHNVVAACESQARPRPNEESHT